MRLRKLIESDAPLMLEWMQDSSVVEKLNTDFSKKTLLDCINFIKRSKDEKINVHRAIVDDENTYMGTVSLKNINEITKCAEFAITVRKSAMGKGYSSFGMSEILNYAFFQLGLNFVYWCVAFDNERAIRFYDKNGYRRVLNDDVKRYADYSVDFIEKHLWYKVEK